MDKSEQEDKFDEKTTNSDKIDSFVEKIDSPVSPASDHNNQNNNNNLPLLSPSSPQEKNPTSKSSSTPKQVSVDQSIPKLESIDESPIKQAEEEDGDKEEEKDKEEENDKEEDGNKEKDKDENEEINSPSPPLQQETNASKQDDDNEEGDDNASFVDSGAQQIASTPVIIDHSPVIAPENRVECLHPPTRESVCELAEALNFASSSDNNGDSQRQSLLADIVQAQLALWTLVVTIFYSYAWQHHRKKFLLSVFLVIPISLLFCCFLSSILTIIVILGRFFSSTVNVHDILRGEGGERDENAERVNGAGGIAGDGSIVVGRGGTIRRRTMSNASCHSYGAGSVQGLAAYSCEEFPKPLCRKHSAEGSSLSLFGNNGGGNGLIVRSDSMGGGYSGGARLTHQYSHSPADGSATGEVEP